MRKAFALALLAPLFAVPLSYVSAGSGEDESRELPAVEPLCWPPYLPYVGVGPRIIHVPDAAYDRAAVPDDDENAPEEAGSPLRRGSLHPAPRRRILPRAHRPLEHEHTDAEPVRPRGNDDTGPSAAAVQPSPPPAERRAILSAPPPAGDAEPVDPPRVDPVTPPQSSGR